MLRKSTPFLFALLLLLLGPASAWSAGLFIPGRGVHPMGRGGASIAGGDTLQAIWYNPANLVEMQGFSTLIDVGLIQHTTRFQRAQRIAEDGQETNYEPTQTNPHYLPDPSLLFAYGWKKHRVTLAFGVYAPYSNTPSYSDTGAQRYAVIDTQGSLFLVSHIAAAWAPHPRFRFGAGIQNHTAIVRLQTAASAYLGVFGGPEDPDLDLYTEASLQAPINISGNVGVWGRLLDTAAVKWDLAASVQMPVVLNTSGQIRVRLPTHPLFDPTRIEGSRVKAVLNLPLIVRAATRVTLFDRADIEAAFVYEGWSSLKELRITIDEPNGIWVRDVPTIGDYRVPDIVVPRNSRDAFSVRVGASVKVLPKWLQIRVGYAFETSATPNETNTVFFYDSNKHLLGIGASITFKNMAVDISYAHILMPTNTITQSNYRQLNPLNPSGAIVIGNGTYDASYNIIGLAWRGSF